MNDRGDVRAVDRRTHADDLPAAEALDRFGGLTEAQGQGSQLLHIRRPLHVSRVKLSYCTENT